MFNVDSGYGPGHGAGSGELGTPGFHLSPVESMLCPAEVVLLLNAEL